MLSGSVQGLLQQTFGGQRILSSTLRVSGALCLQSCVQRQRPTVSSVLAFWPQHSPDPASSSRPASQIARAHQGLTQKLAANLYSCPYQPCFLSPWHSLGMVALQVALLPADG